MERRMDALIRSVKRKTHMISSYKFPSILKCECRNWQCTGDTVIL